MFPITMTFTVSNHAELDRLVAAIPIPPGTNPVTKEVFDKSPKIDKPQEAKEPDPKSEPAAASAAQPADTQATPEPTAAASGAEEEVKDVRPLDYDKDVKPAFLKLVQTKGRQAGRKIIDAFNPTKDKLSEALKPEQYADALALINKELA